MRVVAELRHVMKKVVWGRGGGGGGDEEWRDEEEEEEEEEFYHVTIRCQSTKTVDRIFISFHPRRRRNL